MVEMHDELWNDPDTRDAAPASGKEEVLGPSRDIKMLLAIMAALRDKKEGCPWDIAQSFATIAPYTIEEAFEVADAIARGDMAALKDELGDLLLQVVFMPALPRKPANSDSTMSSPPSATRWSAVIPMS